MLLLSPVPVLLSLPVRTNICVSVSVCLCVAVSVFMLCVISRQSPEPRENGLHHPPAKPCKHHHIPCKHTTHSQRLCHLSQPLPAAGRPDDRNMLANTENFRMGSWFMFFTPYSLSNIIIQESGQKSTANRGCIFCRIKGTAPHVLLHPLTVNAMF